MTRLFYTDKNGKEEFVVLSSEIGFTIKVISVFAPSNDIESMVWGALKAEMAQLNATELERKDCHALYKLQKHASGQPFHLFCVIQSRNLAKSDKENPNRWQQDSLLFHRSNREWIAVAEGDARFLIDQKPVTLLKILQHDMHIQLGELQLWFNEIETLSVNREILQELGTDRKCPFCQDKFVEKEAIILCPSCGTVHHEECWTSYGNRCSGPTGCRYGLQSSHYKQIG